MFDYILVFISYSSSYHTHLHIYSERITYSIGRYASGTACGDLNHEYSNRAKGLNTMLLTT